MGQRRKEIIIPTPRQVSSGKWYIYLRLSTGTYSITDKDYNRCIARARAIKAGVLEEQQQGDGITLMQAIDKYIESRSNDRGKTPRSYLYIMIISRLPLPVLRRSYIRQLQALQNAQRRFPNLPGLPHEQPRQCS